MLRTLFHQTLPVFFRQCTEMFVDHGNENTRMWCHSALFYGDIPCIWRHASRTQDKYWTPKRFSLSHDIAVEQCSVLVNPLIYRSIGLLRYFTSTHRDLGFSKWGCNFFENERRCRAKFHGASGSSVISALAVYGNTEYSNSTAPNLQKLFQKSLDDGTLLTDWRGSRGPIS